MSPRTALSLLVCLVAALALSGCKKKETPKVRPSVGLPSPDTSPIISAPKRTTSSPDAGVSDTNARSKRRSKGKTEPRLKKAKPAHIESDEDEERPRPNIWEDSPFE